jgi:hypothetical protein
MSGYMGLLMGCSRPYWKGILQRISMVEAQNKLHSKDGNGSWTWNQVRAQYPDITNSDMRRLNCSNWFVQKRKKGVRTTSWLLQPDVERVLRKDEKPVNGSAKKKRVISKK